MRVGKLPIRLKAALAIFAVTLMGASSWAAPREEELYRFKNNGRDGKFPNTLTFDAVGNLYGTTLYGGAYGQGTVFELTPKAGGGWTEKVLHSFSSNGTDGYEPYAGLTMDSAGNLYGTTQLGGDANGVGTVFEMTPKAGGGWTEKILHSFDSQSGGRVPFSGLIFDKAGNLYGTTTNGGNRWCRGGCGLVFRLTPNSDGSWTENVLYLFRGRLGDGTNPYGGLVFDQAGNLYGTTRDGGANDAGTVYELKPRAHRDWVESVLRSFGNYDGGGPESGSSLILDVSGNLYGTTPGGGRLGGGTVFELTPQKSGGWKEKVLYTFSDSNGSKGGYDPWGVILDAAGNLYGTTSLGGVYNGGTVFKLTPQVVGGWKERVLHSFKANGTDGYSPYAGLITDSAGNLYGTTQLNLTSCGTVFEIIP